MAKKDHLDAEKVYAWVSENLGPGAAREVVELKATKTRIDDMLKRSLQIPESEEAMLALAKQDEKHRGKAKLATISRVVYRKLSGAGAIWSTTNREVKVHKTKPAPPVTIEEKRAWAAGQAERPGVESEDPRPVG